MSTTKKKLAPAHYAIPSRTLKRSPKLEESPLGTIIGCSLRDDMRRFKTFPTMARAIWLREALENGAAYKAKDFWTFLFKIDGVTYLGGFHNGTAFESKENLRDALKFFHRGNHGSNGSGGKLASFALVDNDYDYHHMILSKTENHVMMYESRTDSSRTIAPQPVDASVVDYIRHKLGERLWSRISVGYIARFDMHYDKSDFTELSMLMKDFSPHTISGVNTHGFRNTILQNNQGLDDPAFKDSSNCRDFPTREAYDRDFAHKSYTLKAPNCEFKEGKNTFLVDASIEITLYHGLSNKATGFIRTSGENKGQQLTYSRVPSYNTFLTYEFSQDPTMERLGRGDPVYAGQSLSTAAGFLNLSMSDETRCISDDLKDFPELVDAITENGDALGDFTRTPHARMVIRIHKIVSPQFSPDVEDSVKRLLGRPDDIFLTRENRITNKTIRTILDSVSEVKANKQTILDLRQECKRLRPQSNSELGGLPLGKYKPHRMILRDPLTGETIKRIKPGEKVRGQLLFSETRNPVDSRWMFDRSDNHSCWIEYSEAEGVWILEASTYKIKTEDGFVKVSPEEWIAKQPTDSYLPHHNIQLSRGGEKYALAEMSVELPTPKLKGTPSSSSGNKPRTSISSKGKTLYKTMFRELSPADRWVAIIGGDVFMNNTSERIISAFRDIMMTEEARHKLWADLEPLVREKAKVIQNWQFNPDAETTQAIEKEWSGDTAGYFLNELIRDFIWSKEVQKIIDKNNGI